MSTLDHGLEVLRKSSEKFENSNSESVLRFKMSADATRNPFLPPPNSDYYTRTVSGSVETHRYYQGGVGGTLLKTLIVTYTSNALNDILNIQVV